MSNRTKCIVGIVVVLGSTLPPASLAFAIEGAPHNGLSSQAFRFNALTTNQRALKTLLVSALDESLFSADGGYIARQMLDPHARAVLTEIVACALDPGTVVSYNDPARSIRWSGRGELGLCPGWPGEAGKRQSCQELVSACITARVNAMDQSIPISLRSDPGRVPASSPLAALDTRIPVNVRFREGMQNTDPAVGALIQGFEGPLCQVGAECAWKPAHVGTCAPGESVQLAIEDPDRCKPSTLRVCSGISGCVKDQASWKPYARFLAETQGACAPGAPAGVPLSFRCPVGGEVKGYYSVMVLSPLRGPSSSPISVTPTASDAPAVVRIAGAGKYPAPEADVFSFLEGAFYGNLFRPEQLKWSCELDSAGQWSCSGGAVTPSDIASCGAEPSRRVPAATSLSMVGTTGASRCLLPVPYLDIYACYSYAQQVEDQGNDALDTALMNSRICDLPSADAKCFAHPLRRCHYKDPDVNRNKGAHCEGIGNDGAYGLCQGQDGDRDAYRNIITTYLNQPDDLIGDEHLAAQLRRSIPPSTQVPAGVPPVPVRRCGCSSDAADGGLASASLAALVMRAVRGRRRRDARHRAPGPSCAPAPARSR